MDVDLASAYCCFADSQLGGLDAVQERLQFVDVTRGLGFVVLNVLEFEELVQRLDARQRRGLLTMWPFVVQAGAGRQSIPPSHHSPVAFEQPDTVILVALPGSPATHLFPRRLAYAQLNVTPNSNG